MSRIARGRDLPGHKPGSMNSTERAYAAVLEAKREAGEILWFAFESLKLNVGGAKRTWWTPDFVVQEADGTLTLVDVKGTRPMDEQAQLVKAKVIAATTPYRVVIARQRTKKNGGGFQIEEVAA